MKRRYFDLEAFKPEAGFEFQFCGGTPEKQYPHACKVLEVTDRRKLNYSRRHDGYEGISFVIFELFTEGDKTRVRLTHEGLETFPSSNPDLARKNFEQGWSELMGSSLKKFLEQEDPLSNGSFEENARGDGWSGVEVLSLDRPVRIPCVREGQADGVQNGKE